MERGAENKREREMGCKARREKEEKMLKQKGYRSRRREIAQQDQRTRGLERVQECVIKEE